MNPYLTIPIALPGKEPEPANPESGAPDKEVPCEILPAQVLAYHEGYAWGHFFTYQPGRHSVLPLPLQNMNPQYANTGRKLRKHR